MTAENWVITVSIGVVALACVALIVYLILALLSVRRMVQDLDEKVRTFDPLFRVVNKAGCAIERKASKIKQLSEEVEEECVTSHSPRKEGAVNTVMEVAEWALIGMALWQKLRERKWRE
jgi:uncharacterized protein YoxC